MSSDPSRDREADVDTDPGLANARDTGGDSGSDAADSEGTTGTRPSEEYVGRTAGLDEGYAGETGAEARAVKD